MQQRLPFLKLVAEDERARVLRYAPAAGRSGREHLGGTQALKSAGIVARGCVHADLARACSRAARERLRDCCVDAATRATAFENSSRPAR